MYKLFSMRENAEEYFSRFPCDLCLTDVSGGRYDYTARDNNDNTVYFSLCVDCVYDVEGLEVESCE